MEPFAYESAKSNRVHRKSLGAWPIWNVMSDWPMTLYVLPRRRLQRNH